MKEYTNFYESIKEARMRIEGTVVLYEGWPHYVLTVCDHMDDGIFRVYMEKLGDCSNMAIQKLSVPYGWHDEPNMTRGQKMDDFMAANPKCGIIRKMMNSPHFNKFRPFPLGMCNFKGSVLYLERTPNRSTYQGLTQSMIMSTPPSIIATVNKGRSLSSGGAIHILCDELCDTIVGNYPSFYSSVTKLRDPKVLNDGVAFHRHFALLRGPLNMLFLVYRSDVIGFLPNNDDTVVTIDKGFEYTKEVVDNLNIFKNINIR